MKLLLVLSTLLLLAAPSIANNLVNVASQSKEKVDEFNEKLKKENIALSARPPNILSREDPTYITCSDLVQDTNGTFLDRCLCTDVTVLGSDYLSLNCGYCVGCANVTSFGGEVCTSQETNLLLQIEGNLTSSPSLRALGAEATFSYDLPDASTVTLGMTFLLSYNETEETTETDIIAISVDGVECDFIPATTCDLGDGFIDGYQGIDCSASPSVDSPIDFCKGDTLAGTPFELFEVNFDPMQCLAPNGEIWFTRTGGDPHITTFDGLNFDCQAQGEFTLVKTQGGSYSDQVTMQGRFEDAGIPGVQASVMTGVVVDHDSTRIQISLDNRPASCDAQIFENGFTTSSSSHVQVTPEAYIVTFGDSFLQVKILRRSSSSFGCFFTAVLTLPTGDKSIKYFGLYGSPDGDRSNDWMASDGTPITLPVTPGDLLFESAYLYCVNNWCIRQSAESLFSYPPPPAKQFSDYNGCAIPYNSAIETAIANATESLKSLCKDDTGCLVDGAVGDEEDARIALDDAQVFQEVVEEVEKIAKPPEDMTESEAPSDAPTNAPTNAPTPTPFSAPTIPPMVDPNPIDTECECGLDACRFFQIFCLLRNNCRRMCDCRGLFRC